MQNTKESFFSIDRLVEFGMGMAMSQQIAKSMNEMMASMRVMPQMQVAAQPLFAQQTIQQGSPMQPVYRPYAGQGVAQQQVSQNPAAFAQAGQVSPPPPVPQQQTQASEPTPPSAENTEQIALPPPAFPEAYYIAQNGVAEGPYSGTEIARLVQQKRVTAATPVWKSGLSEWKTAAEMPELVALIALVPPALENKTDADTAPQETL